eukprot:SAG31_NODE_2211_length_6179_cov_2.919572_9_plen_186_part_00
MSLPNTSTSNSDSVAVIRVACPGGCVVDAIYHSGASCSAAGPTTDEQVGEWMDGGEARFDAKMKNTFGTFEGFTENGASCRSGFRTIKVVMLNLRCVNPKPERVAAAAAISNAIGGMAYLQGRHSVMPANPRGHDHELSSFTAALFTAVPSRPFFPRGFAWDEGFHQVRSIMGCRVAKTNDIVRS